MNKFLVFGYIVGGILTILIGYVFVMGICCLSFT